MFKMCFALLHSCTHVTCIAACRMFLLSLRDADAAANPFDLDTGGKLFRTRGVPSWRVQAHLRTGAKDARRCVVHVVPKVKQPGCRTLPPQSLSQHHLHPSRPQMQAWHHFQFATSCVASAASAHFLQSSQASSAASARDR